MRRVRFLAIVAAAALALAGCATIPTGGSVQGQRIDTNSGGSALLNLPDEPQAGASQSEILEGFIRAGAGPQDSYKVARDFLTDDFRSTWSPSASVLLTPSAISPVQTSDHTMSLTISIVAEVDSAGRYSVSDSPTSRSFDFSFQKNAQGEWRISSAPNGTILANSRFTSVFQQAYPLYFFDPSFQYLVPDVRWFPTSDAVGTRIVSELLAGDSDWLSAGVLASAFPTGTTVNSVTIDGGVATVSLGNQVLGQSQLAQWQMLQQLTYTLSTLSQVRSVKILAGGLPVAIPDIATPPDRYQTVDGSVVGGVGDAFGVLGSDSVAALPGIGDAVGKLGARGASLSHDRAAVAVLGSGGVSLVRAGTTTAIDTRAGLAVPTIDPWGYVWSVPKADPSGLVAIDPAGKPHALPLGQDGRVVSINVSRDGTRLLVGLTGASGSRLVIAGIERDQHLVPTALVKPLTISVGTGTLIDAAWVDSSTVAALQQGTPDDSVTSYRLGGTTTPLGGVADAVQLVSGNDTNGLRLLDSHGIVYRPSGGQGWFDTGLSADFLATPD